MKEINTERILREYVQAFNRTDEENVVQAVPNAAAADWLLARAPRIAVPDAEIQRTYYFRWWVYRKHVKRTPEGFVLTEFHPDVSWAGKYNTIPCAAAHHVREGRWLRESGADPARIMMVGDSEHDFEVARALGVRCVLFSGGHQPREVLAATGAPVIDALAQLLPLLAQLAAE